MTIVLRLVKILFLSLLLTFAAQKCSYANVVVYTHTTNTNTITSVPERESGFYYSDGRGNSISSGRTQNIPVYVGNYPNAVWVVVRQGNLPANAIIYQYVNGYPVYYCKVIIDGQEYFGELYVDQGCIISDDDTGGYDSYQVLVR